MSDHNLLEGVELGADGKISPRDAQIVRIRLRNKIRSNSQELVSLIEKLQKIQEEITYVASIEFFIEDTE